MYNRVSLIGHLGRDPEIRRLESGVAVAKFSVATNENFKDKSGEWQTLTEWHDVVAWRNLAERVERDLKKGSLVFLEGKLSTRKWQDKEGNDRYTTEVVAQLIRPLDKREASGEMMGGRFPSANDEIPVARQNETKPLNTQSKTESYSSDEDDDLPF